MKTKHAFAILAGAVALTVLVPYGTLRAAQPGTSWTLPKDLAVKDAGPRTYEFVVVYHTADSRGEILQRQRLAGEYSRGLPGGEVMWKNVTLSTIQGSGEVFGAGAREEFMEGFRYRNDLAATMAPDFFKGFPPAAVMERNLVWDTGMIEWFGQGFFDRLKLNEPLHVVSNDTVKMPGVGTFHNRDIVLRWIGRSRRNGQECVLVQYHAFFNPLEIAAGGVELKGQSNYWGEIWVSLATKQVEYATLYETVVADLKLAGQAAPQLVNVVRIGTLEPVKARPGR